MKGKKILLTFCLLIQGLSSFSQKLVQDQVETQEGKDALIGATIVEKNSSNGIVSDMNGEFSLIVEDSIIVISYLGYETLEYIILQDTFINISLKENPYQVLQSPIILLAPRFYIPHNTSLISKKFLKVNFKILLIAFLIKFLESLCNQEP